MSEKMDIYQTVSDQIMAKLEQGVVPWRKPFAGYGASRMPRNYSSNRPYRGINVFLLGFSGYASPYWLTFDAAKQAAYEQAERAEGRKPKKLDKAELKKLGADVGGVRKDEKSTVIIFWKRLTVDDKDNPGKKKNIFMLRYYRVFNVEQCDGIDRTRGMGEQPEYDHDHDPIAECEHIVSEYFDRESVTLQHGGNTAYYAPMLDSINIPEAKRFEEREQYYATTFHEMAHSTGHESRLARKGIAKVARSSDVYADEELTAEMGAAMLCGVAAIAPAVIDNAASYIDHWRKKIGEDPKLIVNAAARAQKAADYILGTEFGEDAAEPAKSEPRELALA